MTVDFHSHTLESDGTLTPAELVAKMRARGVSWFSITDHDTTRAYESVDAPGQHVIPGIEINTTWHGGDVHVLGYAIPTGPSPLGDVLERNRASRRNRIDVIVAGLNGAGYPITVEQVLAESDGGHALGRPHVAKALIRNGMISDVSAAFRELLSDGKPGYAPSYHITPLEAIDVVRESGGIPVLAHPGRLKDDAVIHELVERGLAGIEVFYMTHTTEQVARYRDVARRYGLVMTAGSDFHDERYNKNGVGMDVDEADIRPFLDLVA
ncbi:MAG: PHP domain-containing protein [Candidatus Elarobacter sp.]